ncbi:glycosyltransferase family 2 protein [Clostridium sp. 1001275B_160808_H3]|uniref:glycosyltransferase family 2 protein n=1 Tax=Clostridium sp. 1001275B_160808_H3 TaxID=2787110 RepID=UPI0018975EFE|nr:glycosyltransferase family 2 protein [Clostridium sp. 1001275B_160808_H3]
MKKICAIIVTFNRLELLRESIEALINQDYKLSKIIVVNNASTDGTNEYLLKIQKEYNELIVPIMLENNIGGAGGFYEGIKFAYKMNFDNYWIMDDDTIVRKDTLVNMLKSVEGEKYGFVCSHVLYKDNTPCVMNIPTLNKQWSDKISKGLIKVDSASFVSLLLNNEAIEKCGLPIKEFFIWGDDLEYTLRVSKNFNCYMSVNSTVTHKMGENKGPDIVYEEGMRLERCKLEFRNKYYILKKNKNMMIYYRYIIKSIIKILLRSENKKVIRIRILLSGFYKGVRFNPNVDYLSF